MHSSKPIFPKQFDLKITVFPKRIWVRHLQLYLVTQTRWGFHPVSKCAELFCINFIVVSIYTVSKIHISLKYQAVV